MIVEIKIIDKKDFRKENEKFFKAMLAGKKVKDNVVTMTPETFTKIFSVKRLEMLMQMRKDKSNSVSELARKLKRRTEVIYRDLILFEQFGIVKLVKGKRNSLIPELVGEIRIAMPLTA